MERNHQMQVHWVTEFNTLEYILRRILLLYNSLHSESADGPVLWIASRNGTTVLWFIQLIQQQQRTVAIIML